MYLFAFVTGCQRKNYLQHSFYSLACFRANSISFTPGFTEVMEHDHLLALWGFLNLVDWTDEAVNKYDKIYKVRPMVWGTECALSFAATTANIKGMIATKKPLAIKQYMCDKQVRWGIKSFLREAKTSYILGAEIYMARKRTTTGPFFDPQEVLSAILWRTMRSTT